MLLLKSLVSVPSDQSPPWSFFEGKKWLFLAFRWVWKALIFQCLPIIVYTVNNMVQASIADGGPSSVLQSLTNLGISSIAIRNDEIPGFKWKLCKGVWFSGMVCCVKLHGLLRFVIFACSCCFLAFRFVNLFLHCTCLWRAFYALLFWGLKVE